MKQPQEFSSYCLINFYDTAVVANVMQNKDNIIIADCKFNICEQKTSGKNEGASKAVPVVTGVDKKPQNKTIQISNVQAQDLGGGAKSYENLRAVMIKSINRYKIKMSEIENSRHILFIGYFVHIEIVIPVKLICCL